MNHVANVMDNPRPPSANYDLQTTQSSLSGGYPTDGPAQPAPTNILAAAERQAQQHTRALVEVVERLQALRDRAFGSEPAGTSNAANNPPVCGAVQLLAAAVAPHDQLVARIHSLINDIDRLA
jgi:hypothetical protein